MTALLVRLATGNGLHVEDEREPLFLKELNRRLWHFIVFLDAYCAVDRASEPLMSSTSLLRPLPSNVNDADFDEGSTSVQTRDAEVTDMTFTLVIYGIPPVVQRLCVSERRPNGLTWQERLRFTEESMASIERRSTLR